MQLVEFSKFVTPRVCIQQSMPGGSADPDWISVSSHDVATKLGWVHVVNRSMVVMFDDAGEVGFAP